jgi:hypothetical protein
MKLAHLPADVKALVGGKNGPSPRLVPPSPPQVMHPSLPNETLFEQELSNKPHNSLVIKNKSKPKQSIKQPTGAITSTTSAIPVAPSTKKAAQPLAQSHSCAAMLPMPNSDISSSVSSTREKKCILEEYVSKFGSGHQESIITKKKKSLISTNPCILQPHLGKA